MFLFQDLSEAKFREAFNRKLTLTAGSDSPTDVKKERYKEKTAGWDTP
jgi:hypothetical protein